MRFKFQLNFEYTERLIEEEKKVAFLGARREERPKRNKSFPSDRPRTSKQRANCFKFSCSL